VSVLVYLAVPVFFALILLEARRHRALRAAGRSDLVGYERRDTAASLWMGVGNVAVAAAVQGASVVVFFFAYEHRIFEIGTGVWAWVALFFAEDLVYYAFHRSSHEVRFLWAAHENHHSSQRYNLSTALRQSWTTPFTTVPFYVWLPLLGFHPLMVQTQVAVSLLYQFWIHTELVGRLGPLELAFNTPSHHRVHHGANVEYLDRNHGGILILWDRLFGTFEPERAPVRYGLTKNIDTFAPFRIAFHEWAAMARQAWRARALRDALGYLWAPPGWSPDGSTLTAGQLRAARSAAR
jgi:sterol desaturase/sphingolipid hydroxylase (fatty acid hydroxylase superfamily)